MSLWSPILLIYLLFILILMNRRAEHWQNWTAFSQNDREIKEKIIEKLKKKIWDDIVVKLCHQYNGKIYILWSSKFVTYSLFNILLEKVESFPQKFIIVEILMIKKQKLLKKDLPLWMAPSFHLNSSKINKENWKDIWNLSKSKRRLSCSN